MKGHQRDQVEEWRQTRYLAWATLVAERGTKELKEPKDLFPLQGDDDERIKIDRKEYDGLFDLLKKTWDKAPL
ncbi:MAG: hypothetical protein JST46_13210 [Bacteroidetes bacterium]|nr:hypothetical protein [Bacteroidota bacterium]